MKQLLFLTIQFFTCWLLCLKLQPRAHNRQLPKNSAYIFKCPLQNLLLIFVVWKSILVLELFLHYCIFLTRLIILHHVLFPCIITTITLLCCVFWRGTQLTVLICCCDCEWCDLTVSWCDLCWLVTVNVLPLLQLTVGMVPMMSQLFTTATHSHQKSHLNLPSTASTNMLS